MQIARLERPLHPLQLNIMSLKLLFLTVERYTSAQTSRTLSRILVTITGFDQFVLARVVLIFTLTLLFTHAAIGGLYGFLQSKSASTDMLLGGAIQVSPFFVGPFLYIMYMFKYISHTKKVEYSNQASRLSCALCALLSIAAFILLPVFTLYVFSVACICMAICHMLIACGNTPKTTHMQTKRWITFTLVAIASLVHLEYGLSIIDFSQRPVYSFYIFMSLLASSFVLNCLMRELLRDRVTLTKTVEK